jgi:hypothetical protein
MADIPTLDELEEEHWSIVVLAHRLAEAVVASPPPPEIPDMIEELCRRCDAHLRREDLLLRHCRKGPIDGLAACQGNLRRLLGQLRPALPGSDQLAATMVAFEAALIMTLQHDRAVLSALHGLPPRPMAVAALPDGPLE